MTTPASLEKLKTQRNALEARIQRMEALEATRERKRETRRRFLVGTYMLEKARKENKFDQLSQELRLFLTRDSDRKLFNLPQSK